MQSQKNFKVKNNIYKILRPSEWEEASQTGQINTDLDRGDGFIHLSAAYQLNATLSFFFKDSDRVILLQIDQDKINKKQLLYEEPYPNKGKRKSAFPHLYSDLHKDQISNVWILKRNAFELPEDVMLQAENTK